MDSNKMIAPESLRNAYRPLCVRFSVDVIGFNVTETIEFYKV